MNRIGSDCWYKPRDAKLHKKVWRAGTLRAWSTDFVELESGPALFPVGVIEDDKTGLCQSVYVAHICFAAVPPRY